MRLWLEALFKAIVMAATMCSGIIVPKYDKPAGDESHEGGRDIRQDQRGLDRAA